jgi:hypothetical protein
MTDIKRITPLETIKDGENTVERLVDKVNEIALSFNALLQSLKPSATEPNENKGYENEIVSGDPNDKQ